jgi:uncharacterized protein YciI
VQFLVLGIDGPDFGSADDLHEAHWSYMDKWSDVLIARGPTESPDEDHTGSVHIVELPNATDALRFAHEEPYAQAGWYSTITVSPIVACTDGTMWDSAVPAPPAVSSLVTASFRFESGTAQDLASSVRQRLRNSGSRHWIYIGVTRDDDGGAVGLMGLADESPTDAHQTAFSLLRAVGVIDPAAESQPWRRGGRPA